MFVGSLKIIQDRSFFSIGKFQTIKNQLTRYEKKCEVFTSHFSEKLMAYTT